MLAFYMIILLTSWNPEKGKGYLNEVFSYYIDLVFFWGGGGRYALKII